MFLVWGALMVASAKSLFRAMRATAQPVVAGDPLFGELPDHKVPVKDALRRADDFYPTGQPEAIRALLAHDGTRIAECGAVWEPACGDGALVRPIRQAGLPCVASDLVDRGCKDSSVADFFATTVSPARAIITNPPFCLINARDGKGAWLRHTLELPGWEYLALLLSADWPFARINGLGDLLDQHPFSWVYYMRWKLDFTGEGSPPQRNCWYVWDRRDVRGHGPGMAQPSVRFMDRSDGRQGVLI